MADDQSNYADSYSEGGFWDKLLRYAKAAGKEIIEIALQLYYALQNPNTPLWARTVIIGALGYFISPIDAIPDVTPIIGYADDFGVLTLAVATVSTYITDDIRKKAANQLTKWFG